MTCDDMRALMPEQWAGELSDTARAAIDEHLAECADCREESAALGDLWRQLGRLDADEEPSPRMQARFDAMLAAWREGAAEGRTLAFRPRPAALRPSSWLPAFQLAAALLLVVTGFVAGQLLPGSRAANEVTELRGEVRTLREVVTLSLLQQQSASERLQGVTWTQRIDRPGQEVLDALVDTLRRDPNVNVRLAAIDALRHYGQDDEVRRALVDAVGRQESPLVQVSLIDLLVELREPRALDVLRGLANDARANRTVRERAQWGVGQIS